MLNFRIYQYPMFALSSVITMVVTMAMFSGMLLLPIYVQTVRGISPLDAGLLLLPGAIIMAIMSPITGRLFDKFGGRALAIIAEAGGAGSQRLGGEIRLVAVEILDESADREAAP